MAISLLAFYALFVNEQNLLVSVQLPMLAYFLQVLDGCFTVCYRCGICFDIRGHTNLNQLKMIYRIARMLVLATSLVSLQATVSFGEEVRAGRQEFPIEELKGHIYFLASDYLGGRVTDEPGYLVAAEYVRSQFFAAGLKPFFAGGVSEEAYFQDFPMYRKDYCSDEPIILKSGGEETVFTHITDFKLIRSGAGGLMDGDLPVVFAGYGIEEQEEGWNDYKNIDVSGKVVLIMNGAPVRDKLPVLSDGKNDFYLSRAGLNAKLINLIGKDPAAIMLIENDSLSGYYDRIGSRCRVFSNQYKGSNCRMEERDAFFRMYLVKPHVAAAMLGHAVSGADAVLHGELTEYAPADIPRLRVNIRIREEAKEMTARNVVGIADGTDPLLKDEYIVIGAHLDHEPNFDGIVFNGADDNASGVTTVIELAQWFAAHPLKRSIIFIAYAAEEGGCYGSRHFVEHFPDHAGIIAAAMNFDCVGRNGRNAVDRFQTYMTDAGLVCPDMLPLVDRINRESAGFRIEHELNPPMGTSDQESYIRAGIPVVDFFNGGTTDLHRPTDDVERIDFEYLQKMCLLGSAIAEELGNMPERMCAE